MKNEQIYEFGSFRLEVGERHWDSPNGEECYGFNMLLWGPGHTLWGTCDWQSFQGREIDTLAGWIALDIYCYRISNPGSGEHEGELYGNAYVLISPAGEVLKRYGSADKPEAIEKDVSECLALGRGSTR